MDYVAKAQEASRRWREAQGLPPRADLLSDQSFSSSVPRKERVQEEQERLARECSTTETIETTKEGRERRESKGIQGDREQAAFTTEVEQLTTKESRASRGGTPPTFCPSVSLNPHALHEVLGAHPAAHALACLRFDVLTAVRKLERESQAGAIGQIPLLVRGRPLADWLDLDTIARLLKLGQRR